MLHQSQSDDGMGIGKIFRPSMGLTLRARFARENLFLTNFSEKSYKLFFLVCVYLICRHHGRHG